MPSPPASVFLPRNGGSNSIRSTVSLSFPFEHKAGTVVCIDSTGTIRPYALSHPNDPIIGIVESAKPPMMTEIDVVISGIVRIDWIEPGKVYYLQEDGDLSSSGGIPVIEGIGRGEGIFSRPSLHTKDTIPTGSILEFCGIDAPVGWLECDGSLIEQQEYPKLYAILSDTIKPLSLKIVSKSNEMTVLAFDGHIKAGTFLFMSTLGWKGNVQVLSCGNGLLTVNSKEGFASMIQTIGGICSLVPIDGKTVFLPQKRDVDSKWIVKI